MYAIRLVRVWMFEAIVVQFAPDPRVLREPWDLNPAYVSAIEP
ncbi:MAG: hypothetical protein AAGD25_22145 [Cyanobacteria bacterium P01_F01_bin.150]